MGEAALAAPRGPLGRKRHRQERLLGSHSIAVKLGEASVPDGQGMAIFSGSFKLDFLGCCLARKLAWAGEVGRALRVFSTKEVQEGEK